MPTKTIKDVTAAYDHVDDLIAWYIHVENTDGAPKYQAMLFGNENQTVDSVYFGGKFATKAEANASGSQAKINHEGNGVTGFTNGESATGLAGSKYFTIFASPTPGADSVALNHVRVATSNRPIQNIAVRPEVTGIYGQQNWDNWDGTATIPAKEIKRVKEELAPKADKEADKYNPAAKTLTKYQGDTVTASEITGQVTGVPANAQITVNDPSQLTTLTAQPGSKKVPVTVTYADGTKNPDPLTVSVSVTAVNLQEEGPRTRYIWVDNDGEQIQHPFVVASYDANLPVTGAFGTTAAKNDIPVDANAATNLNNGLTYTAKDGKVTVAGGYTANVFKTKSDLYTTNTVIDVNGKKFITDNSQALTIVGVNHFDNQEVPTHAWNQPVKEQEVIDAIKGKINATSTASAIQALRGDNTIISYKVKGGQVAIPTSGSHQAVTVIATLPSNGVDANGKALPGETKELTVYVSYTPSHDESGNAPVNPKTSVDGTPATVLPNGKDQDTGINVHDKTPNTTITAKDKNGHDVPVKTDGQDNIIVTPGKDVDGPITVTVKDPSMDQPVNVTVSVNRHEAGKDDNGSDKPADVKTTVDESGKTPVDPTDDAQDTGVVVKNPTKDTTVTAHDEDGHEVPVKVDDQGHIVVTPGKDVDGPIKVTVDDPSMDQSVNVTVPVNGHEAGKDDNGSDKPTDVKTTVDDSGKTPVNPTDDAQDTGVVVKNPTKDTTVTAHDEDGHEVPVKVDDQGHIIVTPGKDVDGPITVTVKDPSMDQPVNVTVPVNGHEAGKDDNGSDKPADVKTTVDDSGKTPVNPTDDAQDTGVVVKNPTKDTTVTAHDEDGHDVPVKVDDQGHIIVTPGEDVDGPIAVTVDDPSMDAPVDVEVEVNGHTKGNDDNGSDKPDADKVVTGREVTNVNDDNSNVNGSAKLATDRHQAKATKSGNQAKQGQLPQTGNDHHNLAVLGLAAGAFGMMLDFKKRED